MLRSQQRLLICGINYAPETTGIAPYTSKMAEGLASGSWDVSVVTAFPHYPTWKIDKTKSKWTEKQLINNVKITRKLHYVPRRPRGVFRLWSELSFGIRSIYSVRDGADIFLMVSPALISSWIFNRTVKFIRRSAPRVLWVQDLYGLGLEQTSGKGYLSRFFVRLEQVLFESVTHIVTIHQSMAESLAARYQVPPSKISVIRNWSHIGHAPDGNNAKTKNGFSGNKFVVMHTGNMGLKQDLENVVYAAKIVEAEGLPILFVLVGDGSERAALERLASACRAVKFIDPVESDKYPKMLAEADLLLVNEKPELVDMSFPSKLTSYFQSGKPVLGATNEKSITATEIKFAEAGWVVEPGNPLALIKAIENIMRSPDEMLAAGKRGRKHAEIHLSEAAAVSKMNSLLSALISRPQKQM